MDSSIVVTRVGKTFRRYHPERPATLQEAVATGWHGLRRMRSVERFWSLRDVSFSVGAGQTVGIIGANGSGKSTLLRLIGGVGRPDTGRIEVRGRIGALLDLGAGFHPDLTGRENAVLAGILNGLTRRQVLDRLESIVAFAEVAHALDNPMRTFSSGMQMRLAFSVAVHADPDILLIDEVLSVGDIGFQRKCMDRIAEFRAAGCSILLVSHEGSMIEDLCDEAVWLRGGQLMAQGAATHVVREYVASMAEAARDERTDAAPPADDEPVHAAAPSAQMTLRTPTGEERPLDEERFGSTQLEIAAVQVLSRDGRQLTEISSGQSLRIEISYVARQRLVAPIFMARIIREDGLVCCDIHTEFSRLSVSAIEGPGSIAAHIDRLDLNTGRYVIDVCCYTQDWTYAYDYRASVWSLSVRGPRDKEGVLRIPHRWEFNLNAPVRVRSTTPGTGSAS